MSIVIVSPISFFFFNDTATTEIYTLSLHDALPISARPPAARSIAYRRAAETSREKATSTTPARNRSEEHTSELQSQSISYAVFCLKKKKEKLNDDIQNKPESGIHGVHCSRNTYIDV